MEQLLPLNLNEKEEQLYVNKKTRQALLDTNKGLKERIAELEDELNQNTVTLVEIINQVKLKTNLELDDLLSPYLISEFKSQSNLKKL